MKTISAKAETVKRDWFVVDASNKTLGRLATELARRLRGKHKPIYTPHCDTGDYLVVVNAEKIAVTGRKMDDKIYHHVTGYIGNIKSIALKDLLASHPERVIEIAVKGMLPKNPLGRQMYTKAQGIQRPEPSAQRPAAASAGHRLSDFVITNPQTSADSSTTEETEHGNATELWHRPSQVRRRTRVPAPRQGQHRRQRQAAG
jgi:ribosomal protein L13, bacterial type